MSCAGNPWLNTPNIDQLVVKGMSFTKAYVTNPVCSLSRFNIFSGRYQSAMNMMHNASKLDQQR